MTKTEAIWIVRFLEDLSDSYSNAGNNDMFMEDTPENRKLAEEANDWDKEFDLEECIQVPYYSKDKIKKIRVKDSTVLGHLREKFMKENSLTEKDIE